MNYCSNTPLCGVFALRIAMFSDYSSFFAESVPASPSSCMMSTMSFWLSFFSLTVEFKFLFVFSAVPIEYSFVF